jgi:hypothetical protein
MRNPWCVPTYLERSARLDDGDLKSISGHIDTNNIGIRYSKIEESEEEGEEEPAGHGREDRMSELAPPCAAAWQPSPSPPGQPYTSTS